MTRRKATASATKKTSRAKIIEHTPRQGITSYARSSFKWAESYTSLLMGVVVVMVAVLFVVSLIKQTHHIQQTSSIATGPTPTATPSPMQKVQPISPVPAKRIQKQLSQLLMQKKKAENTYIVQSGDDLWHISEKIYGTGYNYVDIARVNNLSNPSMIFSGDKLILPQVTPTITPQTSTTTAPMSQTITQNPKPQNAQIPVAGAKYTVQKSDSLWSIAEEAYNNGYRWTDIAKANNLSNPGLIFSGNILQIPR